MTRYEKIKSLSIDEMACLMAAEFLAGNLIGCGAVESKEEGTDLVASLLVTEEGRGLIEEAKSNLSEEVNDDA